MFNGLETIAMQKSSSDVPYVSARRDPIDEYVGSRLRLARMAVGLTQGKVGEALGISTQQVQKYEKGVNRLGAGKLYRLAKLLDVSTEFFFRDLPEGIVRESDLGWRAPSVDRPSGPDGGDRDALRLIAAFQEIRNRGLRAEIISLVVTISRSLPEPVQEGRSNTPQSPIF